MSKMKKIVLIVAAVMLVCFLAACGSNGICTSCGKTIHGSAYGNPMNSSERMCESCARQYYMGLDLDNFKID